MNRTERSAHRTIDKTRSGARPSGAASAPRAAAGSGAPAGGAAPDSGRPGEVSLLLCLAAILILTALLAWRMDRSMDLGFHLGTGRYILSHGRWPLLDPFTYTVSDHAYLAVSGLFGVLVALVDRVAGPAGMTFLQEILILPIVAVLWLHARRRGVSFPALLLSGFAVAILSLEMRFQLRPELVSYLMLALFLYLLQRHHEDGRNGRLFALIPLQLVWTWSHPMALFGPIVIGLYAAASYVSHRRAGPYGRPGPYGGVGSHRGIGRKDRLPWIVLLLFLILFANPYGIRGMRYIWGLQMRLRSGDPFARTIGELISPFVGYKPSGVRWFFVLLGGTGLVLFTQLVRKRLRTVSLFDVTILFLFGGLAAIALRNIGLFVVAALPIVLEGAQKIVDSRPALRGIARRIPIMAAGLLVAAASILVLTGAYYLHGDGSDLVGSGPSPIVYPIRCVDRIEADKLGGPIYNPFGFGGYLIGRLWPREKVFIVGNTEVIGGEFFREFVSIEQGPGWDRMVRKYDPNIALLNVMNYGLVGRVAADTNWVMIEADGAGVLFVRNRPANVPAIEAADARFSTLDRPIDEPDGSFLPPPRSFLPRPAPREEFGRAIAFETVGMMPAAWRELREAAAKGGGDDRLIALNVAAVCQALGRTREAAAWNERRDRLGPIPK
jgi:hypothetical protein